MYPPNSVRRQTNQPSLPTIARATATAILLRVESDLLALAHDPLAPLTEAGRDNLRLAASLVGEVRI